MENVEGSGPAGEAVAVAGDADGAGAASVEAATGGCVSESGLLRYPGSGAGVVCGMTAVCPDFFDTLK